VGGPDDDVACVIRFGPRFSRLREFRFEVERLSALGDPLVPLGANDRLFAFGEVVVGAVAGQYPLDITLTDARRGFQFAADADSAIDLLDGAAMLHLRVGDRSIPQIFIDLRWSRRTGHGESVSK